MSLAIVSGALANKPFNGGNAWTRLSWVQGLRRVGFEVLFLEELGREACVDAVGSPCAFEESVNLAYFKDTMARFGLERASALIFEGGEKVWGMAMADLVKLSREARLLFNLSGHLTHPEIRAAIPCSIYYDDDPGFTQFWHATGSSGARLAGHDFHFTIGENIGAPDCVIPTGQIRWRHTRPPVVLDDWPVTPTRAFERFTTVASWRGAYGPVSYNGKTYGLKVHEFRKCFGLPRLTGHNFEIALQIHPADHKDLEALLSQGWIISDPKTAAGSPEAFRAYVQASSAEFSVAQGIYVDTHSGWFSDRTVRYLASGKPALVQDTGFSRNYPVGEGLVAFRNLEEAIEGAGKIVRNYPEHCQAARRIAKEYFDADEVIRCLLKEIGLEMP